MDKTSNIKDKILTVIGTIMCVILVPILLINLTLIAKSYLNKDEVPNVGGYLPLIVLTDSMHPEIESGDLIICHTVESDEVKANDVIAFFDPAGNGSTIVTHRVIEIIGQDGDLEFRTKGDFNNTEDKMLVPEENLVGIYQTKIPGAGHIAMFMQTTNGLLLCVVLPIVLLIGWDVVRRSRYEKQKQKDTDALMKELEALRAEKAKQEKSE